MFYIQKIRLHHFNHGPSMIFCYITIFGHIEAFDNKNYMIEDTGNLKNMTDVKSNFTSFLFPALFS